MSFLEEEFFTGKRTWSLIKDEVLSSYLPAYIAKVAHLGKPILLIDGYAGPGAFADDENSLGSPSIICNAAESYAKGQYAAVFVNHNEEHHNQLSELIEQNGWSQNAIPLLGDSSTLISQVSHLLNDYTVFLYLDPFGLKGCEFSGLLPFLERPNKYSTEIVFNISMPITHRLAAANSVNEGSLDQRIISYHARMTEVFGGDYWKDIYFSNRSAEEKEYTLVQKYLELISNYLPITGACPVREKPGARVKYYIVFASRHIDSMLLMNDIMCKAYFGAMHKAIFQDTLFANTDWKEQREQKELEKIIVSTVTQFPGLPRARIWEIIVKGHFMRFTSSEFKKVANELRKSGIIYTTTETRSSRMNDRCLLYISDSIE